MCVALVTDASESVLKVSICFPCLQIAIQKQLVFEVLIISEIMLPNYSAFFGHSTTNTTIYFYIWSSPNVGKGWLSLKLRPI